MTQNAPLLRRFVSRVHGDLSWGLLVIQRRMLRGEPSWRPMRFRVPATKAPSKRPGWSAARKQALERDKRTCQKCAALSGLEVHHIKERVFGGKDELANLITLCSECHAEWTFCQPPRLSFEEWRSLPPARLLVEVLAEPWPDDVSAAAFRERLLLQFALATVERINKNRASRED